MKITILSLALSVGMLSNVSALGLGGGLGGVVHDPIQTAETVAQLQKQLEAWAEQAKQMGKLNEITDQISAYSEQLNGYIGDAKESVNKVLEIRDVIDRLGNLDKIDDLDKLELEIGALTDILDLDDILNKESDIYGNVATEIEGVKIEKNIDDYKRHALTVERNANYGTERETVVSDMDQVQKDLSNAIEKASKATNQAEQLAILTEIEAINARLLILSLRLTVVSNDVQAHVLANQDRDLMEEKHKEDAMDSLYADEFENLVIERGIGRDEYERARRERYENFKFGEFNEDE